MGSRVVCVSVSPQSNVRRRAEEACPLQWPAEAAVTTVYMNVIARTEANLPAAGTDTPQFCFYLKAPVERACHVDLLSACLLLSCLVPASSSVRLDGCQSGRTHRIRALAGEVPKPCCGGGRGRGGPLVPGGAATAAEACPRKPGGGAMTAVESCPGAGAWHPGPFPGRHRPRSTSSPWKPCANSVAVQIGRSATKLARPLAGDSRSERRTRDHAGHEELEVEGPPGSLGPVPKRADGQRA